MASFIAKQPNGLYCRFSTVVDCPTHINMTEEDYLNNVTGTVASHEEGKQILERYLQPFQVVIDKYIPNNLTKETFELLLQKMNSDNVNGYEVVQSEICE